MEFNFYDKKDSRGLINNVFSLAFTQDDLPFAATIIPTTLPALAYFFGGEQIIVHKKKTISFKSLTIVGQFSCNYEYFLNNESFNLGINLHPTALYKILGKNVSMFTNNHVSLEKVNDELFKKLNPIFLKHEKNVSDFIKEIIEFIDNLELIVDKDVVFIDKAITYISENDGMIQMADLLKIIPFSQKSIETKFKKIIGLTPGKYIRLIRFTRLMRKYENNEIDLNDLIYMYNYHDHSHFIKDFKLFMLKTPKEYFKKEYPLIKAYSKDL
ncbi:helix-turn-helix domain-containing protein [Tenacibaculum haliotis]|uniref:helix-turn-helix domain-containing protein n=1 Tax=Tenacibaculum haliotis TaxID=1888914 RepID=UPI0021AFDA2C|nr:helix-turn-helix domain-containing protein [Tenacibaculum haliotis]MCT4698835.1 helix-turn-helix domain-containing protein [Tenacibaculum haliotis]